MSDAPGEPRRVSWVDVSWSIGCRTTVARRASPRIGSDHRGSGPGHPEDLPPGSWTGTAALGMMLGRARLARRAHTGARGSEGAAMQEQPLLDRERLQARIAELLAGVPACRGACW
jgi:hypothetical protein